MPKTKKQFFPEITKPDHKLLKIYFKGATKSYIAHYLCMVILLFNRLYVGQHFLWFLLEN